MRERGILYLALQSSVPVEMLPTELGAKGIGQWVYLGEDSTWRVQAQSAIPADIPRISLAELMDETSMKLRQPYIDWIGQLSQLNDSVEWWASSLAEKNPYGGLYTRLCLLAAARELMVRGVVAPTLAVCSTQTLLNEVDVLASRAGVRTRSLVEPAGSPAQKLLGKTARRYLRGPYRSARQALSTVLGAPRMPSTSQFSQRRQLLLSLRAVASGEFAGRDAILLFTWVDRRNFGPDGSYRDPHFGPLPDMLRQRGFRVAYVPRVFDTISFEEAVERLLKTKEQLFFPELLVAEGERQECQVRARCFRPRIPRGSVVGNVPSALLALEHVEQTRNGLAENLVYERLIANLSASGVRPRQIVHTCEGHAWEQVVSWAARRYMPGTKVVGYENGVLELLRLCMYPAPSEVGRRPLPDRIVTNGRLSRSVLLSGGVPPDLLVTGCGLRHTYLWESGVKQRQVAGAASNGVTRVLVATAISFGESVELASKAAQAFGGDPAYEVVVKCHPLVDPQQVAKVIGAPATKGNIQFVTTPVSDLLGGVDILLYTHTYVCFEALQYGVFPVLVKREEYLNLDKLSGAPEVRWVATTPEDLRRVAEELVAMPTDERRRWQDRALQVVRSALPPVTPDCVEAFLI